MSSGSATLVSAHDGTEFRITNVRHTPKGDLANFVASISGSDIQGSATVDGYMSADLPNFFKSLDLAMASAKGWSGAKEWGSLEGELIITATSDSLGHVTMTVMLKSGHYDLDWSVQVGLLLEAGQLATIAENVANAFAPTITT